MSSPTAAVLGEIGLPVSVRELAAKTWDVIVVGAGHNGLACAAYLAQTGQRVLVIESRTRVGGTCPSRNPLPGVRMSPCAYLAGLLHPLVVKELGFAERESPQRWLYVTDYVLLGSRCSLAARPGSGRSDQGP